MKIFIEKMQKNDQDGNFPNGITPKRHENKFFSYGSYFMFFIVVQIVVFNNF